MCYGHSSHWKDWERAQREQHDVTLASDPEPHDPVEPIAEEELPPEIEREQVPAGAS